MLGHGWNRDRSDQALHCCACSWVISNSGKRAGARRLRQRHAASGFAPRRCPSETVLNQWVRAGAPWCVRARGFFGGGVQFKRRKL